jgi:hypothetical protein
MELLKDEPGSCSETYQTSSYNENKVVDIKVEEVSVRGGEERDPLLIPFTPMKPEYDVSFVCIDC